MTTKVSGVTFKRFYADPAAWPGADGETYHDDAVVTINGMPSEDLDLSAVEDAAVVEVSGGFMVSEDKRIDGRGFEQHLKDWIKRQSVVTLVVEVDSTKVNAVIEAVKAAGGSYR